MAGNTREISYLSDDLASVKNVQAEIESADKTTPAQSFMEQGIQIGSFLGIIVVCAIVYIVITSESFGEIAEALGELAGAAASIAKMFGDHPWLLILCFLGAPILGMIGKFCAYLDKNFRVRAGKIQAGFTSKSPQAVIAKISDNISIRSKLSENDARTFDDEKKRLRPNNESLAELKRSIPPQKIEELKQKSPVRGKLSPVDVVDLALETDFENIRKLGNAYFKDDNTSFNDDNWKGEQARNLFEIQKEQGQFVLDQIKGENPAFVPTRDNLYALLMTENLSKAANVDQKDRIQITSEQDRDFKAGRDFVKSYTKSVAKLQALGIPVDQEQLMKQFRSGGGDIDIHNILKKVKEFEKDLNDHINEITNDFRSEKLTVRDFADKLKTKMPTLKTPKQSFFNSKINYTNRNPSGFSTDKLKRILSGLA